MSDIPVWPRALQPSESEFWPWFNTKVFESPFSRAGQVLEYPGCVWRAQLVFRNLDRDLLRQMEVFTLQLRGAANRVRLGDPVFDEPRGPAEGTPLVDGSGQDGVTLRILGCTPEQLFLATGDYFTVGDELKRLTADGIADIDGKVDLYFEPPLRSSPANSTPLQVRDSFCLMRLDDDEQLRSKRRPLHGDITLNFTEALY